MSTAVHNPRVSHMRAVHLPRLHQLRDEALMRASKVARLSPVAHEWARLGREHRVVFMLLAGIDESEEFALKDWGEFTPPEVRALTLVMRDMKRAVSGLVSLVRA